MSTADLSAKMGIAYKEGQETKFWLNLLYDSELISEEVFEELLTATDEICRILFSILKKTRYKDNENLLGEPDIEYLFSHIE
ncbi:MAG: four helix bundle protein [Bacteroidota bacterium]